MKRAVVKCALASMSIASALLFTACAKDAADGGNGDDGKAGTNAGAGNGAAGTSAEDGGIAGDTDAQTGIGVGNGDAGGEAGTTAADGGGGESGTMAQEEIDGGTDAGMDAPTGVTEEAEASCEQRCVAQESFMGCEPMLELTECKTVCATSAEETLSSCSDEFKAYYDCTITDGFRCVFNVVAQKTGACADEKQTFDDCQK